MSFSDLIPEKVETDVEKARRLNFPPSHALKRFAADLKATEAGQKLYDLNQERICTFLYQNDLKVQKTIAPLKQPDSPTHPKFVRFVPGVFDYHSDKDLLQPLTYLEAPECQNVLGSRSRFGDGDGSFWDKWMNADSISSSIDTIPSAVTPHVGFKRFYESKRAPIIESNARTSPVKSYALRNSERKLKEGIDTNSPVPYLRLSKANDSPLKSSFSEPSGDVVIAPLEAGTTAGTATVGATTSSHVVNTNTSSSPLPPIPPAASPLKVETDADESHTSDIVVSPTKSLKEQLPDSCTSVEKDSYFGHKARETFFEFHRQLTRQRYAEYNPNAFNKSPTKEAEAIQAYNKYVAPRQSPNKKSVIRRSMDETVKLAAVHREHTFPAPPEDPHYPHANSLFMTASSQCENVMDDEVMADVINNKNMSMFINHLSQYHAANTVSSVTSPTAEGQELAPLSSTRSSPSSSQTPLSPRTKFLTKCVAHDIYPKPVLLIRREFTSTLNLSGQGIGDELAGLLAESLIGLPYLETLNISNNRLTDPGLTAILSKLPECHTVNHLDISKNKLDSQAADMLCEYLKSPMCSLNTVIMQYADVDDLELGSFLQEAALCTSLKKIDLSHNLLGSHEIMNSIMTPENKERKGVTSCGEVLAELMVNRTSRIETLILSGNNIRLQSALQFANSLRDNSNLTFLDLSYNKMSEKGGEILGNVLPSVKNMTHLNLNGNEITPRACFTIAAGLHACLSLKFVNLMNNPIGNAGAEAILQAQCVLGDRISVDITGCSVRLVDPACYFDYFDVDKPYSLNLAKPYDRAVCLELLRLASVYAVDTLKNFKLTVPDTQPTEISFVVHKNLKPVVPTSTPEVRPRIDTHAAETLFNVFDEDDSGYLSRHEIVKMLQELKMNNPVHMMEEIMAVYDLDGSNSIHLEELMEFLKVLDKEIQTKVENSKYIRYLIVEGGDSSKQWVPPLAGLVDCEMAVSGATPDFVHTISHESTGNLFRASKSVVDSEAMVNLALNSVLLDADQAIMLYHVLLKESGDTVDLLHKLLPRLSSALDARKLFTAVAKNNSAEKMKLKIKLGYFCRAYFGNPNGFYKFNLFNTYENRCFRFMVEINAKVVKDRKTALLGDLSQFGNWVICFRNVVLDGSPVIVTSKWLQNPPNDGCIEFDFVDMRIVENSAVASTVSNSRICHLLMELDLITDEDHARAYDQLMLSSEVSDTKSWEMDFKFAVSTFNNLEWFYANYQTRSSAGDVQSLDATILDSFNVQTPPNSMPPSRRPSLHQVKPDGGKKRHDKDDKEKVVGHHKKRAQSMKKFKSAVKSNGNNLRVINSTDTVPDNVIAIRSNDAIEDSLCGRLITCAQLQLIVMKLRFGFAKRNEYGTFRVELIVTLMSQVVDIFNFELVQSILTPLEVGMLYFRLGFLYSFNPMKPQGYIQLNCARWEEKQVLRMLLILAVVEGPAYIFDFRYKLAIKGEYFDDCTLPPPTWFNELSCPSVGIVSMRYNLTPIITVANAPPASLVPTEPQVVDGVEVAAPLPVEDPLSAATMSPLFSQMDNNINKASCRHVLMTLVFPPMPHSTRVTSKTNCMERVDYMTASSDCRLSFSAETQKQLYYVIPEIGRKTVEKPPVSVTPPLTG